MTSKERIPALPFEILIGEFVMVNP